MGFFKQLNTIFRGKKHEKEAAKNEIATAPTSIDNLKVGGFIEFGFLPLIEEISGKSFTITGNKVFTLHTGEVIEYAELEHGEYFVRREGKYLEVLTEIDDNEAFIEAVEDNFFDVLTIDEGEYHINDDDQKVISGNETMFELHTDFQKLKAGVYRTVKDDISVQLEGVHGDVRFLRAKSNDGQNYITLFYVDGGETFINESVVVKLSDVSFL